MTRLIFQSLGRGSLVVLLLTTTLGGIAAADDNDPFACDSVGDHGTQIFWIDKASEAGKQARRQKTMLMVMHISGDFTQPTFT